MIRSFNVLFCIVMLAMTNNVQAAGKKVDLNIKLPPGQHWVRPATDCVTQDGKHGQLSEGEKGRRCETVSKGMKKDEMKTQ